MPLTLVAALACLALPQQPETTKLDLGAGTVLEVTTPAPVLWGGEVLPAPVFDAQGQATTGGLTLKRTIDKVDGGYRISLSVTNGRDKNIELRHLIPLQVAGQKNFQVAETPVTAWTIFRIARHKNDIPGPYRPTVVNDASKDAATDSVTGPHGGGKPLTDDAQDAGNASTKYHADPGFVVMADGKPASTHLFIGFDGQTDHLSDVLIEIDPKLTELQKLSAIAEFDGVVVAPGATRRTHDLYLLTGKDCDGLLADHVERIKKRYGARLADLKNVFCTWYFYGPEIIADDLRKDIAEMKKRPVKFDIFLIDYNWDDFFGDWNADLERFPKGMKAMADEIKAAGLAPGIWSCPFLIDAKSETFKRHPEIILKDRAGKPLEFKLSTMGTWYILDPTAPAAEPFLTEIAKRLTGWGYRYLKFDFLRAVTLQEDVLFHDRTMGRAQAYKRGIDILRKAAGEDALIGTWGGLFEANAGFVNINRPGSDVRGHWDPVGKGSYATRYPVRMRQTFARAFYDQQLWTSDQDAIQLRRRDHTPWRTAAPHLSMGIFTDEEAFSTVLFRFLGGGIVQVSEKLDDLDQDRYDLYKMVIPTWAPVARRIYPWTEYLPEHFVSHFSGHKDLPPWAIVSLCNWNGNAAKKLGVKVSDIPDLPKASAYAAFEFKTQKYLGVFKPEDSIQLDLEPHAARVIRLTPLTTDGTYLIGSDLNLSCGMEIDTIKGKTVKLKDVVREFNAKFTFLSWKDGKAALETVD